MKDPNSVAKLEKAIAEKYGPDAIVNPRSRWSEEDEISYQQQLSGSSANTQEIKTVEEERDGYNIEFGRLITAEQRVCSKCGIYSMNTRDSLYLNKFSLCYLCFQDARMMLICQGKIK